jgi:RNA polymerase sigma-54 factor
MRLNFCPSPLAILGTVGAAGETLPDPDLIIQRESNTNPANYKLQIPGADEYELKISTSFQNALNTTIEGGRDISAHERTWIRNYVDRAWTVVDALNQRWGTLRRIGDYLILYQREFLDQGLLYLKPLTQAKIARELGLHESTISRAVNDKLVQLPNNRLMLLSDFFASSLATKEAVRTILKESHKTLCDREIAESLQVSGINISRRTVAKYRQEINLQSCDSRQPIISPNARGKSIPKELKLLTAAN